MANSCGHCNDCWFVVSVTDEIQAVLERLLCIKWVRSRYVTVRYVTYCYKFSSSEDSMGLRLELDSLLH